MACAVGLDGGTHAGQFCGVLGFCRFGGLLGHCDALADLGQLHGLGLAGCLHVGEFAFQCFNLASGLVELRFQVVNGLSCIRKLALGLRALFPCGSHNLMNPALCCLHGLVVQFYGQRGKALGQRLGHCGHFFSNLYR